MKVGFVSYHSFYKPGGVQSHIVALKEEFNKRGISTKIIIPRAKRKERYSDDIIFLGKSIPITFKGTEADFSFASNLRKIKETLKKENFDILHFHNFGILSYQILKNSNALNILTVHTGYEKEDFFKKDIFSQLKFKGKSKILKPFLILKNHYSPFRHFIEETKKRINGVIAVSPQAFKLLDDYSGPKKIIPNGIDLKMFSPNVKKIKKFDDKYFNILFLGRIEERKGLIYLLKAYQILQKKFNNLRLIVVGEGKEKKNCEDFVRVNNLKNVFFEGKVANLKTPSYYRTADVFVSPAIYGESFGIVLLEAMATGTPVVAFSNEGYKSVMEGEYKNFLAEPKNFLELANKIEIFIRNPDEREKMRKLGLVLVKKYAWNNIASQILDFYKECGFNLIF